MEAIVQFKQNFRLKSVLCTAAKYQSLRELHGLFFEIQNFTIRLVVKKKKKKTFVIKLLATSHKSPRAHLLAEGKKCLYWVSERSA